MERARSRRRAGTSGGGLARDCADGLLLADVLEGVTGQKVPRAHRKPRNPQQMVGFNFYFNINILFVFCIYLLKNNQTNVIALLFFLL